ncbi:MAG: DEAD/DEAH box helicase family protein [Victivallaceae bacterium]|nr:DEAD/DEAH box helicase family protein [Victivallaceae bacterium]
MKFKFDANQQYQLDAIDAVVDIFDGQQLKQGELEINFQDAFEFVGKSITQTELGFGNNLQPTDEMLDANIKNIQKLHNIHQTESIKTKGRHFSVEMETGTGKTYVYLRTAFELSKKYGFKKFIIVVPSVAIREGVLKSIDIMKEHFRELYNNVPFRHFVYNSKHPNELRSYATGNEMQLMIINIDAFNKKDNNIIHDYRDKMGGRRPIEFIQATSPIVIMDEPQNMESVNARAAIESLRPMCTLRYSATHRDKYNMVYQLDPVKAFQMKLVKKISVNSVVAENDPTQAYLKVEGISNVGGNFKVKLRFYKNSEAGPKTTTGTFKKDDDLFAKSGGREMYRNFRITEINARPGMEFVKFANSVRLKLGEEQGGSKDEVVKKQISETIRAHFEKELQVNQMGLKVLSLFFLDRVDNYRIHTEDGYQLGRYGQWFEEIYNELSIEYKDMFAGEIAPVDNVHNGYFSKDKKGILKDTKGNSQADTDTYSLIMKDKETLLSMDNPLKFIFSHSALREGWDNPNVFQICTLNESASILKKRQEIGRGLRLPVNQNGERVFDEYVNNLVVVANESYNDFVDKLQKEFQEDCNVVFGKLPIEAFADIQYSKNGKEQKISMQESETIWGHLKTAGWIASDGFIKTEFKAAVENHTFAVPVDFKSVTLDIIRVVEQLQIENHITNHNNRVKGKINNKTLLDPEFQKFWNTVNSRTVYSVNYSTEELIENCAEAIMKMDEITPPRLRTTLVDINVESKGVSATMVRTPEDEYKARVTQVPDILSYIQGKVELTRSTIFQILDKSKRLDDFRVNPQRFMDAVVKEIRDALHRMIIEGIQYERLEGIQYEMSRFYEDEHKLEFANDRIVATDKSVYNYIAYDSGIEKKFAEDLEGMKNIKFFIKLPGWFKIPTPIGNYNPDWAILKKNGEIVYMIRETKSTKDKLKLRIPETDKIACGYKHFESIGVNYDVATSVEDSKF